MFPPQGVCANLVLPHSSPRIKSLFLISHLLPKRKTEHIKLLSDWITSVHYMKGLQQNFTLKSCDQGHRVLWPVFIRVSVHAPH